MAVAAAAVVVTVATDAATMNVEADAATKELKIKELEIKEPSYTVLSMPHGNSLIFNSLISILFTCHYFQYQLIRFIHSFGTYFCQIADTLIHILINNTFYGSYTTVFHGHDG